jgi:hypothetical protein
MATRFRVGLVPMPPMLHSALVGPALRFDPWSLRWM